MKKRFFARLLCAALVLTLLSAAALPAGAASGSGACGTDAFWSFDRKTGTLTVSGTGNMYNFSFCFSEEENRWLSDVPWDALRGEIKSAVISGGISGIGSRAFSGCAALTSVTLPDSVRSIGEEAFFGCSALTAVEIPEGVTVIGMSAFQNCTALDAVSLPDSLRTVETCAFENTGCANNPENRPDGVLYLGTCLLRADITLAGAYEIRPGTLLIADRAFELCDGLTSVTIPDGVRDLGLCAFAACGGLRAASVPGSVDFIGIAAFLDCAALTSVSLSEGTESIGGRAFSGCTSLTSVSVPDSVTFIGAEAFHDCAALTSAAVPEGVSVINRFSFAGCKSLRSVSLPSGLRAVEASAFEDCAALAELTLPENLEFIGQKAFKHCDALTRLAIPDGVADVGGFAFAECAGLKEARLSGNPNAVGEGMFAGCTGLTSVTIPEGVTVLRGDAFNSCAALTSVIIPGSVTGIERSAFYGCAGLRSVVIPDSVTGIGDWAFCKCTGLTDVYYTGAEEAWNAIAAGRYNEPLTGAAVHFNASPRGYSDLNTTQWFYTAADFAVARGLMGSTKTGVLTFEPYTKVSRAMVASILYRMAGGPAAEYRGTFTDVKEGKWFTAAVEWCAGEGIASGRGNGTFDPMGDVTRQELAVFMKKTAEFLGRNTDGRADLSAFADAKSVPAWAKTCLEWAADAGLISGKTSGGVTKLAPADNATRAELASIIMRFVQNVAEAEQSA